MTWRISPSPKFVFRPVLRRVRLGQARAGGQKMPKKPRIIVVSTPKMAVFWAEMDDPRATSTQVGPAEGPEAADMHVQTPRPVTCRAVGFLGDLGFLSLFGLKNTSFHLYKLNESMTRPATPDDQNRPQPRFSQVQKMQILTNFEKSWQIQKKTKKIKSNAKHEKKKRLSEV